MLYVRLLQRLLATLALIVACSKGNMCRPKQHSSLVRMHIKKDGASVREYAYPTVWFAIVPFSSGGSKGGARDANPLRGPILSFSCSFQQK